MSAADWALVATPAETIVVLDALIAAVELGMAAVSDTGVDPVASRVGMGPVWRAIARDRTPVSIQLRDGSTVTGTPDRVGADFVDVACHELGAAPRSNRRDESLDDRLERGWGSHPARPSRRTCLTFSTPRCPRSCRLRPGR